MHTFAIQGRPVGPEHPPYVIAELSANHHQRYDDAVRLVRAAADAGADAVKLQTYTADTMTLRCDNEHFKVRRGTVWEGRHLHDLYAEAMTPWEWQPRLKELAEELGMALFSSPFDATAVDFLAKIDVPAYKVASFELVDLPLIRRIAVQGKPVIMSTGMATLAEIDEGVRTARAAGARDLALLKCNSAYPAPPEEMNLRAIPHLAQAFGVPVGLSDHTLDPAVPAAAVALGACILEKHLILSRAEPGPDSAFSLEPHEFKAMVQAARSTHAALGQVRFGPTEREVPSLAFRRSLFVVEDVRAGEALTERNVRAIRPGAGLHTRHLGDVLGRRAARDIARGTPLSWDLVAGDGK